MNQVSGRTLVGCNGRRQLYRFVVVSFTIPRNGRIRGVHFVFQVSRERSSVGSRGAAVATAPIWTAGVVAGRVTTAHRRAAAVGTFPRTLQPHPRFSSSVTTRWYDIIVVAAVG